LFAGVDLNSSFTSIHHFFGIYFTHETTTTLSKAIFQVIAIHNLCIPTFTATPPTSFAFVLNDSKPAEHLAAKVVDTGMELHWQHIPKRHLLSPSPFLCAASVYRIHQHPQIAAKLHTSELVCNISFSPIQGDEHQR
jgi:hypothetical protein